MKTDKQKQRPKMDRQWLKTETAVENSKRKRASENGN